jgi:DNA-binding GntR family transcriptional regulator
MAPQRTRAEGVFDRIRGDILAGRLRPGQRLRYGELSDQYGTSMGVLRESLLRLAEQGLVRGEPQQGFQVTPLSGPDLSDLSDAREEIEALTLRHAIADGDIEWESRLIAAHHRLARTPEVDAEDPERFSEEWAQLHGLFHRTLLDGCANRQLKAIAQGLRDASELYRRWSLPLAHDTERHIGDEHADILNAILARDAGLAESHLRAHIKRTTTALLVSLAPESALLHPGELKSLAPIGERLAKSENNRGKT